MCSTSQSNHAALELVRRELAARCRGRTPSCGRRPTRARRRRRCGRRPARRPRRRARRARAVTSSPAASSPRLPTKRASAPSSRAQAATFAACPPAPVRVVAAWSSPGTSGCVESRRSRRAAGRRAWSSRTSTIVAWTARRAGAGFARLRSAGSSARPGRSRRRAARRGGRAARRDAPGGLVAFEDAPCFLELVGEQAQRYREGGETSDRVVEPDVALGHEVRGGGHVGDAWRRPPNLQPEPAGHAPVEEREHVRARPRARSSAVVQ